MRVVTSQWSVITCCFALCAMLAALCPCAEAQQSAKAPRIGLLLQGTSTSLMTRLEGFQQALRERGYVEGKNIALEQRFDDDREERLPELAADLVRLRVDVIVAAATPAVMAAKQATATIPIIIVHSADPAALGLVTSLPRPGGNVTGLSSASPDYSGKQLELLKEAVPKLSRIAVLWNAANPGTAIAFREMQDAVRVLKLALQSLEVRRSEDLAPAFKNMPKQRGMGLVTLLDPLVVSQRAASSSWRQRVGRQQYTHKRNLWRPAALWHMVRISRTPIAEPPFLWTRFCKGPSRPRCPLNIRQNSLSPSI